MGRTMRWTAGAIAALMVGVAHAQAQPQPLEGLAWLAGCWTYDGSDAGSGEQWLAPAGGTMLGVGRTVKNGTTTEFEFMRIHTTDGGKLAYTALHSGQPQATFEASSLTAGAVTFENLQHDFPQRIIYRAVGSDRLAARVEGMRDGTLRGIDVPMTRGTCGARRSGG